MFRSSLRLLGKTKMTMRRPTDPLIVIIGATGTGKSQLAVDLATKYNGEIINGDAMQMYDGLPIITNKITPEEQNGIPHHLLGIVGLDEEPWRVGMFKKQAGQVIKEIRSRGRLPILVGGTHYYTQSLLFDETLVTAEVEGASGSEENIPRDELDRRFPILTKPTEEILEQLREVDPVMADRWHPNDRRKIQRSLEIYLLTGRQASKVYEEQRHRKKKQNGIVGDVELSEEPSFAIIQSTLIFWVHAESELLKQRLDERVDKMINRGLVDEVTTLNDFLIQQTAAGVKVDRSSGIWVSIGFKEFESYLDSKQNQAASIVETETALANSVEHTKAATRQYAKRQRQWIRIKLLAALSGANSLDSLYVLDGSDLSKWSESVSDPAIDILGKYLAGEDLPKPSEVSSVAQELLSPKQDYDFGDRTDLWIRQVCEMCNVTSVTEEQWQRHLKSRGHRRHIKKANRSEARGRPVRDTEKVTEQADLGLPDTP